MNNKENLSELTTAQLTEKKKKLTSTFTGIAVAMVIIFAALIYFAIKSKNYALIAVAMGSSITLLPGFTSIAQINAELKKRQKEA